MKTETDKVCPFTKEPRDGCYCLKEESRYAEAIMNICGSDYKECEIFRKETKINEGERT